MIAARTPRLLGATTSLAVLAALAPFAVPSVATAEPTAEAAVPATESTFVVDDLTPPLRPTGGAESSDRQEATATGLTPFTTIGASYRAGAGGTGRVRAHTAEGWSRWFRLRVDRAGHGHGPDPGSAEASRGGPTSDPIWVGVADGYQLSLPADARAVRVHLVRPTGEAAAATPEATTEARPGAAPAVHRRASWGARSFRGTIEYNRRIVRGVVHHTVNSNGYTRSQVPSMLRAIQAYHQDTRGWSDIAYNFVVDRFGQIWEARARSYSRAVVGAASSGTNYQTVAVAYLGDAQNQAPPSATLRAIGRTLGWKLRKHGLRPRRSNIMGHRDIGQTACPGNALYRQLGVVEAVAISGNPPDGPYLDVPWRRANARAIAWAGQHGIMRGFDDGDFKPRRIALRGDAYLWLWRSAGSPPGSGHPYTDIPSTARYREAVEWASDRGIARGVFPNRFGPGLRMSRAVMTELLWRFVGQPRVTTHHGFTDAGPSAALDWARAFGLFTGTTFHGNDPLTRGRAADLLYRLRPFSDVGPTHVLRAAVDWARIHSITRGYGDHTFRPTPAVTRGQASDWIWRFLDRRTAPVDPTPGTASLDRATAVTWIWQAAGSPTVDLPSGYDDVEGEPHEMAAAWSEDFLLFPDITAPTFGATVAVTRGQLVRALFRLADRPTAWNTTPPVTVRF